METGDETPDITLDDSLQPVEEPAEEDVILSDDPENVCRLICGLCRKSCKIMRHHLKICHASTTPAQFRALFPTTEYSWKTYHRWALFCLKVPVRSINLL